MAAENGIHAETLQSESLRAINRIRELELVEPQRRARNVNDLYNRELLPGDRAAIIIARKVGSWSFLIFLAIFLGGWAILNVIGWIRHWDPYPFVVMNLVLSVQAAFIAPLIMMAQNRQADLDRLMLQEDFETNHRAAEEISHIRSVLEEHGRLLAFLNQECCHVMREGRASINGLESPGP